MRDTTRRYADLDFIRGFAILTITINHYSEFCRSFGFFGRPIPTLTSFGYSSAAELFFLISGYFLGYIYTRPAASIDMGRITVLFASRAFKLYLVNALLFTFLVALAGFLPADARRVFGITHALGNPVRSLIDFLTMVAYPPLLGILNYYVIFILAAIAFAFALRVNAWLALALSFGVYLATYVYPDSTPAGGPWGGGGLWAFNPFAWQFIFFAGFWLGHLDVFRPVKRLVQPVQGRLLPPLAAAVLALFVLMYGLRKAEYLGYLADFQTLHAVLSGRRNLGALRIVHTFVVLLGLLYALLLVKHFFTGRYYGPVEKIGRNSLSCFVFGVIVSYGLSLAWFEISPTPGAYDLFGVAGLALMFAYAVLSDAYGWHRRRRAASTPLAPTTGDPPAART